MKRKAQIRRLRIRHGLDPIRAALLADHVYGGKRP